MLLGIGVVRGGTVRGNRSNAIPRPWQNEKARLFLQLPTEGTGEDFRGGGSDTPFRSTQHKLFDDFPCPQLYVEYGVVSLQSCGLVITAQPPSFRSLFDGRFPAA